MIAATGTAHRLWVQKWVSQADQAQEAQAREFREQVERVKTQLEALPPESQALVHEVLAAHRGELKMTPLMMSLSRFSAGEKGLSLEERVLEGARAAAAAWRLAELWLTRLLWLAAGILVGLGMAGLFLGQPGWLSLAARACGLLVNQWFLWTALGCTVVFALAGGNPWMGLPLTFHIVPAALLLAGFLFHMQAERPVDDAVEDALLPLTPPLASFALTLGLGLFG